MAQRRTASALLLATFVLAGIALVLVLRGPRTYRGASAQEGTYALPAGLMDVARQVELVDVAPQVELAGPRRASEAPRDPVPAAERIVQPEPLSIVLAAGDASRSEVYVLLTSPSGELVIGASCTFVMAGEEGTRLAPGCCPSFAFESDEAGYVSASLEPGRWVVEAYADGLVGRPESIAVAPGEVRELAIEMTPTVDVTGRVLDASTRAPVADALVWSSIGTDTVRSGTDGAYRLTHAPASSTSTCWVSARAPGYGTTVATARGPDGGARWLDLELVPGQTIRGRLVLGGGVAARIEVSGIYVSAGGGGRDDDATRSAADGAFVLDDLRSDVRHTLTVTAPGYARYVTQVAGAPGVVDLGAIVLEHEAELSGVVTTSDGTPAIGLSMTLYPDGLADTPWRHTCTTGDDGRYRVGALGAGRWKIGISGLVGKLGTFGVDLVPGLTRHDIELDGDASPLFGRIAPVPERTDDLVLEATLRYAVRELPIAADGTFRAHGIPVGQHVMLRVQRRAGANPMEWTTLGGLDGADLRPGQAIVVPID